MSWLSSLTGEAAIGLLLARALLALVLWVSWRKPTLVFVIALASLAIRPQLLWGGPEVGYEWGMHQTLIVFALALRSCFAQVAPGSRREVVTRGCW